MAEKEENTESSNDMINIKILQGKNFKGVKGEPLGTVTIKAQFGEKSLGDIQKLDCSLRTDIDLKYSVAISCPSDDVLILDEIAYRPLVLTFAKILPREKKKKEEEKATTLGQCTIDLLPIIKGEKSFEITQEILPVSGSLWESLTVDHPKPEIDIVVSISQSLQEKSELTDFNILTMTVESVVSPPECLTLSNHIYVAALTVPLTNEKENLAVFSGAQLRSPGEKESVNKQKKWVNHGNAQGGSLYIPNCWIADSAIDDEYGDFRSKEDKEYRKQSEQEKNRFIWNMERRCFLHPSAVKTFQSQITKQRYWPVEVFRTHIPSGNKGKKEEEGAISYHGIAYVDASPLLYPGVQTIRGAYKITPFSELALQEKTGCTVGITEEAAKAAISIHTQSGHTPSQRKNKEERKDVKKTAKTGGLDASSELELSVINTEGQQYVEAKSYIMLEMTLKRPLIQKRTVKELSESVASYIPPRPLFPKRFGGAERAVSDFHKQVECVSRMVLEQFRQQFKEELTPDEEPNPTVMEERKRKLLYELNNSGKYFTYKERLKHAVVKIVREKYLKTSNFEDKQELQNFLSQLYIFLMDQMHVALNKFLCLDDQPPIPEPLSDSSQLKHFAIEAELNGNIILAVRYHEERISRDKNDANHWLDYGVFCLSQQDIDKAEECLRKCVAIDQENFNGLLLFSIISSLRNLTEVSETFFETVLMLAPKSIIAWTLFGLFHDAVNNEIRAEMAFLKANQLNLARFLAKDATEADVAIPLASPQAVGLLQLNSQKASDLSLTEMSPKADMSAVETSEINNIKQSHSEMPTGNAHDDFIAEGISASEQLVSTLSQSAMRSNSIVSQEKASTPKSKALEKKSSRNQSSNHNLKRKLSDPSKHGTLLTEEKEATPVEQTPVPEKSIFMVTIEWLLQMKAVVYAERALSHELLLTQNQPSLQYYISLAQINILKKEFAKAEKILEDSLQISYEQPDTWAVLGHVKYFMGDAEGAQNCYEQTLAFVSDATDMHPVYLRLASIYLQEKKFHKAREIFLMACQSNPSSVSWLGVGIACYRMDKISEAEASLCEANILNNMDPEVWAYLSLVCLKKQRKFEAEQSFKYALKLGFQDKEVIKELEEMQQNVGFGNPAFLPNHISNS